MRIKTFSEELYYKVVTAAENAKVAADTAYAEIYEAYAKKARSMWFFVAEYSARE